MRNPKQYRITRIHYRYQVIKYLVIILALLMALDILTTYYLMEHHEAEEWVFTSRWLIERSWWLFVAVKMGVVAIAGGLMMLATKMAPNQMYRHNRNWLIALNVYYVLPLINNGFGIALMNGWVQLPEWL